jgi:hypothetical protein
MKRASLVLASFLLAGVLLPTSGCEEIIEIVVEGLGDSSEIATETAIAGAVGGSAEAAEGLIEPLVEGVIDSGAGDLIVEAPVEASVEQIDLVRFANWARAAHVGAVIVRDAYDIRAAKLDVEHKKLLLETLKKQSGPRTASVYALSKEDIRRLSDDGTMTIITPSATRIFELNSTETRGTRKSSKASHLPVVTDVVPNSLADHAGIQKGDVICRVNGITTCDCNDSGHAELGDALRGSRGSKCQIEITREGVTYSVQCFILPAHQLFGVTYKYE